LLLELHRNFLIYKIPVFFTQGYHCEYFKKKYFFFATLLTFTAHAGGYSISDQNKEYHVFHHFLDRRWVWAGAGFIFTASNFNQYIQKPLIDYQTGFAGSFWKAETGQMVYGALIYDFSYSKHTYEGDDVARYYFSNGSFVVGYEQAIGTKYLSFFAEVGPSVGQRHLYAISEEYTDCIGGAYTFNGLANLGLNIHFNPHDEVSTYLRIASQFMIGTSAHQSSCLDSVNANPLMFYAPVVAFAVRW